MPHMKPLNWLFLFMLFLFLLFIMLSMFYFVFFTLNKEYNNFNVKNYFLIW